MNERVKIDKAKYKKIFEEGEELEAVYRIQEAGASKTCHLESCPLGKEILPTMRYARVYYEDEDKVEVLHVGCFRMVFPDARG